MGLQLGRVVQALNSKADLTFQLGEGSLRLVRVRVFVRVAQISMLKRNSKNSSLHMVGANHETNLYYIYIIFIQKYYI